MGIILRFNENLFFSSAFKAILAAPVFILSSVLDASDIPSGNKIKHFPFSNRLYADANVSLFLEINFGSSSLL